MIMDVSLVVILVVCKISIFNGSNRQLINANEAGSLLNQQKIVKFIQHYSQSG